MRLFVIALAVAGAAAWLAAPAGSGGIAPPAADGVLVMGVAGTGSDARVVTREWAMVADPISGTTRRRLLTGGTLCHGPVLAAGDRVIFSGFRGRRAVVRTLPLDMDGSAQTLGFADTFALSATRGRLWLGRWSGRALREVDATGRVHARAQGLLPRFGSLHAAVAGGFVGTEGRWLTLRRPGQHRPLLRVRDGWFAAAGRSSFAWCRGRCRAFHVWSRAGVRTLPPPAGMRPLGPVGALSPDQQRLAVGVAVRGRDRVAVADVRTGRWILVPGGQLGGYRAIAWSPSGEWLYFTAGNERVLAWRFGARGSVQLPIRPGGTVMSIATAEASG
ncbi:MAG: hypothetical protein QOH58_632 [Thermoleophilaceae bacterium]|jgi:hypothetical protein|nr:hypothetical protein [Thermoleophilaceae bacterium]